jgi:hypothetical protein
VLAATLCHHEQSRFVILNILIIVILKTLIIVILNGVKDLMLQSLAAAIH